MCNRSDCGNCSQDLKTGFIVRRYTQRNSSLEKCLVSLFLSSNWFRTTAFKQRLGLWLYEAIPAPQATMMKMLVEGIMSAELPWSLIHWCLCSDCNGNMKVTGTFLSQSVCTFHSA